MILDDGVLLFLFVFGESLVKFQRRNRSENLKLKAIFINTDLMALHKTKTDGTMALSLTSS